MNSSVIAEFYCSPVKMRRVIYAVFLGKIWVMADASSCCGASSDSSKNPASKSKSSKSKLDRKYDELTLQLNEAYEQSKKSLVKKKRKSKGLLRVVHHQLQNKSCGAMDWIILIVSELTTKNNGTGTLHAKKNSDV